MGTRRDIWNHNVYKCGTQEETYGIKMSIRGIGKDVVRSIRTVLNRNADISAYTTDPT